MIIGAHSIIYSKNEAADRAFLRDVLKLTHVDVGHGWLIFGLPPAEVAIHPGDDNDVHEFYLMCDDVEAFVHEMRAKGCQCTPVQSLGWGMLTHVKLPGGGKLGVYQARHARPTSMAAAAKSKAKKTSSKRPSKSTAKKASAKPRRAKARR